MSDAQTAWDMEQLAEALEHRGQHESEGRWSIDVDINVELPLIIAALKRSDGPNERCPFAFAEDDGTTMDCVRKGHCGCKTPEEKNAFLAPSLPQSISDPAELLLSGLVGLVQLICHRSDVTDELRKAIAINHRYVDAVAFIERHDATRETLE